MFHCYMLTIENKFQTSKNKMQSKTTDNPIYLKTTIFNPLVCIFSDPLLYLLVCVCMIFNHGAIK